MYLLNIMLNCLDVSYNIDFTARDVLAAGRYERDPDPDLFLSCCFRSVMCAQCIICT